MCLYETRRQPQRYSLFNFISFLPRCTNRNMYDSACQCCILYTGANNNISVVVLHLCFAGRESTEAQSTKPNHPNTPEMCFCCASRSSRSPDWMRLMHLCYLCHATWLLFNSCFPSLRSLQASHALLSKIAQNSTVHNKDRRWGFKSNHKVVKNFKVSVVR